MTRRYSGDGVVTWIIYGGLLGVFVVVSLLSLARSATDITCAATSCRHTRAWRHTALAC